MGITRRDWIKGAASTFAMAQAGWEAKSAFGLELPHARPALADRHFSSSAIEELIPQVQRQIGDPALSTLFANCFPNTLDTTVFPGTSEGKPDTFIVTGDIAAMWLRDSAAQVWPYLPLARQDEKLRFLLEGVIRRQTHCILLDPYANAFQRDSSAPPLEWAIDNKTEHRPGVAERKWELDSLCYPVRLAYGYWQATGDTQPFDAQWREAGRTVVHTFRTQQRTQGQGPYSFLRVTTSPNDTLALSGYGNPGRPVGLVFSMFRPSDDACIFPLFIPANQFAVVSLRQLATLASKAVHDDKLAAEASALAAEIEAALQEHGTVQHPTLGRIWAYEVDGYGGTALLDDGNAPGLLTIPYLGYCRKGDPLYRRTRQFALSAANPYFVQGKVAEGIGGPHVARNMIWPMSITFRALTSQDDGEIRYCLRVLRDTTAGTGFIHESFDKDDPFKYTRPWFAWANTLFGELVVRLAHEKPALLAAPLD
ncbi:glycoside hydrolase family 125 protein [Tunturiibacter empetritectus]|uniref:Glycoside hydrolase family 125 protein n=1 Tax=Tunturiibacter lichenicola TaxID=2051959 RepID=A0A852VIL7_9BACT|nr:glycoside hydrolase family 125 protein [Edaphobacter lichenicola]NYF91537.1 hypothetical protein [Edaphobacter lichenicola]